MNSYKMNLNRRKFLTNTTAAVGGIGMAFASVPFIGSWLPSAKAKALGAPVEVDIEESELSNDVLRLPSEDIYLSGWNMSITVDFSMRTDFEEIEVALSSGGEMLEILSDPTAPPLAQIELPHQCDDVVDWSINNGILDITLKLTPQGSALETESEDIDDDIEDDLAPVSSDVSVDLADDDDDEDDGGIPIF